jgi:hypothetical protein
MKNTSIPQLLVTTDYDQFKIIDSNREVNKNHLRKLINSIESKNLLYLFPLVINNKMEVIDGQHRLSAAKELGIPVYYMIDNTITKADIAMMNSNRKGWLIKDYIYFHAKEGNKHFEALDKLLEDYPKLTVMSAVRLMDEKISAFYEGGSLTNGLRAGTINTTNLALAKIILSLAQKLRDKQVEYAFNGYFLLDIKNAIIQSGKLGQQAADMIDKQSAQFPKMEGHFTGQQQLRRLKDILGVQTARPRSSASEVKSFLERESIK